MRKDGTKRHKECKRFVMLGGSFEKLCGTKN